MSVTDLIIEERSRDIGDFLVGRFLPFRKKRMVGPFIFIDHMGPTLLKPGHYMDVDQHPHIGLATLTYLTEGELLHSDSLGTVQRISPGAVNLMVAGKGVTHTERTPADLRKSTYTINGYQIWIALPEDKEDMKPDFHHIKPEELPSWSENGISSRLIIGDGFGRNSPVPAFSPIFMVEIKVDEAQDIDIAGNLKGEIGIIIDSGRINACNNTIEKGQMLVSKAEDTCKIRPESGTHLFIFGGQALPEERYIDWNFVSHSREKIDKARDLWINKGFPKVPGDNTYVPLPGKDRQKNRSSF
jgi:redox-sensitive bicupin YhaK (pirin superfamily)